METPCIRPKAQSDLHEAITLARGSLENGKCTRETAIRCAEVASIHALLPGSIQTLLAQTLKHLAWLYKTLEETATEGDTEEVVQARANSLFTINEVMLKMSQDDTHDRFINLYHRVKLAEEARETWGSQILNEASAAAKGAVDLGLKLEREHCPDIVRNSGIKNHFHTRMLRLLQADAWLAWCPEDRREWYKGEMERQASFSGPAKVSVSARRVRVRRAVNAVGETDFCECVKEIEAAMLVDACTTVPHPFIFTTRMAGLLVNSEDGDAFSREMLAWRTRLKVEPEVVLWEVRTMLSVQRWLGAFESSPLQSIAGQACIWLRHWQDALGFFQEAANNDHNGKSAFQHHRWQARCHYELQDYTACVAAWKECLNHEDKTDPQSISRLEPGDWLKLASAARFSGQTLIGSDELVELLISLPSDRSYPHDGIVGRKDSIASELAHLHRTEKGLNSIVSAARSSGGWRFLWLELRAIEHLALMGDSNLPAAVFSAAVARWEKNQSAESYKERVLLGRICGRFLVRAYCQEGQSFDDLASRLARGVNLEPRLLVEVVSVQPRAMLNEMIARYNRLVEHAYEPLLQWSGNTTDETLWAGFQERVAKLVGEELPQELIPPGMRTGDHTNLADQAWRLRELLQDKTTLTKVAVEVDKVLLPARLLDWLEHRKHLIQLCPDLSNKGSPFEPLVKLAIGRELCLRLRPSRAEAAFTFVGLDTGERSPSDVVRHVSEAVRNSLVKFGNAWTLDEEPCDSESDILHWKLSVSLAAVPIFNPPAVDRYAARICELARTMLEQQGSREPQMELRRLRKDLWSLPVIAESVWPKVFTRFLDGLFSAVTEWLVLGSGQVHHPRFVLHRLKQLMASEMPRDELEVERLKTALGTLHASMWESLQLGTHKLRLRPVSVSGFLVNVLRSVENLRKDVRVDSSQVRLEAAVALPRFQLKQVLGNLLANALKAALKMPGPRTITISANLTTAAACRIVISNPWDGSADDAGKGTGLGLKEVHSICEKANGSVITCPDATNKRWTVEITLPTEFPAERLQEAFSTASSMA